MGLHPLAQLNLIVSGERFGFINTQFEHSIFLFATCFFLVPKHGMIDPCLRKVKNTIALLLINHGSMFRLQHFLQNALLAVFSIVFTPVFSQTITPQDLGFTPFTLKSKSWGEIHYLVSSKGMDQSKPILLYLDGSGASPLFEQSEGGLGTTVVIDFHKLAEEYHVILISKPGLPYIDTLALDRAAAEEAPLIPEQYTQRLSLDWRVETARLVLKKAMRQLPVSSKKVAVIGLSEGFQVGAKLAAKEKRVTHLILGVGNGLNQFFDFIIQSRNDAMTGHLTYEESSAVIDSLFQVATSIYAQPESITDEWYGHSYLRWGSFTNNIPMENILALDIPVYIFAAAQDRNTSILGTDYLYLESLRRKKSNIVYRVYPVNHAMQEVIMDNQGNRIATKDRRTEILDAAMQWLKLN